MGRRTPWSGSSRWRRRSGTTTCGSRSSSVVESAGERVVTEMTTEALVPAAAEPAIATGGAGEIVLPQMIVDAGPSAVARFLEFFAGRIANARTRAAYGRAVGQFLGWCEARGLGLREVSPLHVAAYIRDPPGVGPHGEAAPGRDPHARRLARRQPGPPREPRGRGAGAEARRHQGRDASPDPGRGEEAPRAHRHGHAGRAPRPGALFGDAVQLRAGERGSGDEDLQVVPHRPRCWSHPTHGIRLPSSSNDTT